MSNGTTSLQISRNKLLPSRLSPAACVTSGGTRNGSTAWMMLAVSFHSGGTITIRSDRTHHREIKHPMKRVERSRKLKAPRITRSFKLTTTNIKCKPANSRYGERPSGGQVTGPVCKIYRRRSKLKQNMARMKLLA